MTTGGRTASPHCRFNSRPPWGATAKRIGLYLGDYVSIHAPAWGATFLSVSTCSA